MTNVSGKICAKATMSVHRSFSRGEQHQHFAYLFQIADDAMIMDVNKMFTLYVPRIMPYVYGRRKGGWKVRPPGF